MNKQKLSFFGIFALGVAGTTHSVFFGSGESWQMWLIAPAAFSGLMAATFLGWLNLPTFEKYITVPFVKLVLFFNHAPEHDQYLAEYEERQGGRHG